MQAPFVDPLLDIEQFQKRLPLVGREAEMQILRMLLNTVFYDIPHGPRALTISGDVGVGKSRLLAEIYSEAQAQGFRVLAGRAFESASMFPYLPFIEILRPVIRSSNEQQLRTYVGLHEEITRETEPLQSPQKISLSGTPLVSALAQLFPELPRLLHIAVTYEELSPDQEKFRLLDAIATFIENIAQQQPVLLSIDNLQWADSASLELTTYLTVRLHNSPVALLGASRLPGTRSTSTDSNDAAIEMRASITAAKTLSDLLRHGLLLFLPISTLNEEHAAQHLHALLPGTISQHITYTLLNRAEGNPFFLEELVRMLTLNQHIILRDGTWRATRAIDATLPESITGAVEQRLHSISPSCREFLRTAALFGRSFPLDPLQHVSQITHDDLHSLLTEATAAALIADISPIEETWDDHTGPFPETAQLSSIAASDLIPATFVFCQGIVQEVLSAEIPRQQARELHAAIGAALETHYGKAAPAHAAELARHYALSGEKEATLRWSILAGEDAARQQAHREAINHFRLALKLIETGMHDAYAMPSPAQLHLTIGESWFKLGQLDAAAQSFQRALDAFQQEQSPQPVSLLLAQANRQLSDVYRMQGKYEQARTHLQAAQLALDSVLRREAPQKTDDSEDASVQTSPAIHHTASAIVARTQLAPWLAGRTMLGSTGFVNAERFNVHERILLLQAQATLDLMHFQTASAEAALWESHQLATEIGDRSSQGFALHFVGWIRGWGEQIHTAIGLIKQANDLYIAAADPFRAALGDQALGIIYTALGGIEEAQTYTEHGLERARRYGVQFNLGWLYWNQGMLALFQGDWDNSTQHFEQAMQEAEANQNIRLKPIVLQAQAELQFRRGNWPQAEQLFQSSIQASAATEWYPGTLALYGHFLAVTGRGAIAQEHLDLAAGLPEPSGFAGDFYIPFLAEGYIHLNAHEQAATYTDRIRALRGFMYYGNSVDRILGVIATQTGDLDAATRLFEEGLTLCRHARNQPEVATILYEQARSLLAQSGTHTENQEQAKHLLAQMHTLCEQARSIFVQYDMQRSVALVDTLLEGAKQLGQRESSASAHIIYKGATDQLSAPGYILHLNLTKRELEVLRLVSEGHTDREVADALVISTRTVNRHLSNIFVKLDVPGRAAAVAYAIRLGVV